jgi:hypothetical protein
MAQKLELKISGLKTNPSQFGAKEGALKIAKNIVIDRPNTAGSRRGLDTYNHDLDDTGSGSFEGFFNYNSTLFTKYGDTFYRDDNDGDWLAVKGSYTAPDSELKTRSVQNNGSFFFTTDAGLYKMESTTADPELAGIPRAIGMDLALVGDSGFFTANKQIAYRVVWGKKDVNGVVSLGYPSERGEIANVSSETGEYTDNTDVQLTIYIPNGITTDYFFQVYRSGFSANENTVANDELQLVYENNPTAAEITAGSITFIDNTPDSLRGATIYTAPSQEGILQANELPPLSNDITMYKNYCLFANTRTRHFFNLTLLSVGGSDGLQVGDIITIGGVDFTAAVAQNHALGEFLLDTTGTAAENIANTTKSLVQVINRYNTNTVTYAYYTSGFDELPGQMLIQRRDLTDTSFNITYDAVDTGNDNGDMFNPPLSQVARTSTNENKPNRIYVSKIQQVDAVPTLQFFDAGQDDSAIKRIISLRDSAWALKDNGEIYRLVGETVADFQLLKFDSTTSIIGSRTATVFNNQIWCFTDQGVVAISDSGVAVRSFDIEDQLKDYFNSSTFPSLAFGVTYESERKYLLHTGNETFVFNSFTNAWTKWDTLGEAAFVNPTDNKLYWGKTDGFVYQERKNFDRFDYADKSYDINILSAADSYVVIDYNPNIQVGQTIRQGSTSGYISAITTGKRYPIARYTTSGTDADLTSPSAAYNSATTFVPVGVDFPDDYWFASDKHFWHLPVNAAGQQVMPLEGDFGNYGDLIYDTGSTVAETVRTFAEDSFNGLQTVELPRTANGTTDGGSFKVSYNKSAWQYAIEVGSAPSAERIFVSQNGSVYIRGTGAGGDEFVDERLVTRWIDNKIGPAGSTSPEAFGDIDRVVDDGSQEAMLITLDKPKEFLDGSATSNDFIDCELQWLEIYGDNPGIVKKWKEMTVYFRDMNDQFKVVSSNNFDNVNKVTTTITPTYIGAGWGTLPWGVGPWGGNSSGNQENRTYFPIQFMRAIWQNIKIETNRAFTNFTLNAISIIYEDMDTEFTKATPE